VRCALRTIWPNTTITPRVHRTAPYPAASGIAFGMPRNKGSVRILRNSLVRSWRTHRSLTPGGTFPTLRSFFRDLRDARDVTELQVSSGADLRRAGRTVAREPQEALVVGRPIDAVAGGAELDRLAVCVCRVSEEHSPVRGRHQHGAFLLLSSIRMIDQVKLQCPRKPPRRACKSSSEALFVHNHLQSPSKFAQPGLHSTLSQIGHQPSGTK